ncbi:hypothetical protein [Paucimonas lemoignei]|nr:hypothetical protein [Paucimonas lemoignei]
MYLATIALPLEKLFDDLVAEQIDEVGLKSTDIGTGRHVVDCVGNAGAL